MKTLYFTVRENGGEHIGTLIVTNNLELNAKLKEACESHFDETVNIPDITIDKIKHSTSPAIDLKISIGEDFDTVIEIQETWVY